MPTKTANRIPRVPGARAPAERARNIQFAKTLREILSAREMSQSDLAAKIWGRHISIEGKNVAIGRDKISGWASGKNYPSQASLEKLANALDMRIAELAPEPLVKPGEQPVANWSITQLRATNGVVFLQTAQYVPGDIAFKIYQLLLQAQRELEEPSGTAGQKAKRLENGRQR